MYNFRVHYGDTDAAGVMYHAAYIDLCERARSEWLCCEGLGCHSLREMWGVDVVVHSLSAKYKKSLRLHDTACVYTRIEAVGAAHMTFIQEIVKDQVTIVELTVKVAFVSFDGRIKRLSRDLKEIFQHLGKRGNNV